jgi:ribosomal protein S18 acetylase RimI-like enzyme
VSGEIMTESNIRRATAQDAGAIALLTAELGYSTNAAAVRSRIEAIGASPSDLLLVAADGGDQIIGWLQAHSAHILESGFRVEITGLVVSSKIRRGGVGRLLVAAAERWAIDIQAEALIVRSNIQRVESHAFYQALGFSGTKTQQVYRKSVIASPAADLPTHR